VSKRRNARGTKDRAEWSAGALFAIIFSTTPGQSGGREVPPLLLLLLLLLLQIVNRRRQIAARASELS